jgi:hypothetical protein
MLFSFKKKAFNAKAQRTPRTQRCFVRYPKLAESAAFGQAGLPHQGSNYYFASFAILASLRLILLDFSYPNRTA